jgi:MFS family permease
MQFNAYILTLLIPSTTLAEINRSIGPSLNYSWVTISWTLAASITVSVSGRLSDIFGRRYFMLGGACIALVGCIVGATGQNINQMIASGVILGTGSGIQEMAYACIQEIVPNSWRLYAIGMFPSRTTCCMDMKLIIYQEVYSISWPSSLSVGPS